MDNKEDISWIRHSQYVLLTLERILDAIEKDHDEISKIKQDFIKELTLLKEHLRTEFNKLSITEKKEVKKELNALNLLIDKLNTKIIDVKEKDIVPLKMKVAILSLVGGTIGGVIISILVAIMPSMLKILMG
ncbi:MAG: hypothetical protein ACTSXY_15115 [Promethearchaeota archaeon]